LAGRQTALRPGKPGGGVLLFHTVAFWSSNRAPPGQAGRGRARTVTPKGKEPLAGRSETYLPAAQSSFLLAHGAKNELRNGWSCVPVTVLNIGVSDNRTYRRSAEIIA